MSGLFIGIGGTGDWILTLLKDKVTASLGSVPDSIQFRLIDTLAEDYRVNNSAKLDGVGGITKSEYLQLADKPSGRFLKAATQVATDKQAAPFESRWFDAGLFLEHVAGADLNLVRGAGQHRQIGRMGVVLNRLQIITMIRRALEQCSREDGETPIWIVGSIAGGTGAGIFMDIAALARLAAEQQGAACRLIGVAALPGVYKDVSIDHARAYAVMRELSRLQAPVHPRDYARAASANDTDYRFRFEYDQNLSVSLPDKLFSNLVFYNEICENEEARITTFSKIADGLNLLLEDAVGDKVFNSWINAEEGYAASFNSYRVFLPVRLYENQFVHESIRTVIDGLLPTRSGTAVLDWGSDDDRKTDALRIMKDEGFPLLRSLLNLSSNEDIEKFSRKMTSEFIVRNLLGFANPQGVYREAIGEDKLIAAEGLHKTLCESIDNYRDTKETFENSKTRFVLAADNARTLYEGDGRDSHSAYLQEITSLVEGSIDQYIDESFRDEIGKAELALGRTIKILRNCKELIQAARDNLIRVTRQDRVELERLKGLETEARESLDDASKPLLGKGSLPRLQDEYADSINQVAYWSQRLSLTEFLDSLIDRANSALDRWLTATSAWEKVLLGSAGQAQEALTSIEQRLIRQTQIKSAAMGVKNTKEMDGYRQHLRTLCTVDTSTDQQFSSDILSALRWQFDPESKAIVLSGWPEVDNVAVGEFSNTCSNSLKDNIYARMAQHEGMAKYLEWLSEEKGVSALQELVERLKRVTSGFVDNEATSPTRRFILLHGDQWPPGRGDSPFDEIFKQLKEGGQNFSEISHNLTTGDGQNMFEDKNVIAILATDVEIKYDNIPVVAQMKHSYEERRADEFVDWRAETYHIFAAEKEAWQLERELGKATGVRTVPMLNGSYYRVLDDPARVRLFCQAYVANVVRRLEGNLDGPVWVCGEVGDDENAIWLTDPTEDLFRAMVTFVMDKRDRRKQKVGNLQTQKIRGWIEAAIKSTKATPQDMFTHYISTLELPDAQTAENHPREAFVTLALNYYLSK